MSLLLSAGSCQPPDPELENLAPEEASFSCTEAGPAPLWTFEFEVSGPVSDSSVRFHAETDDHPDPGGTLMTVAGSNELSTTFEGSIAGTTDGAEPLVGELPLSCEALVEVRVLFCASPEGRPSEKYCWACGDGSGALPDQAEDWIACD